MTLPVNELFETIQGEATWTGTPSVFIRLQGCDVGCPWCDTKHTWKLEGAVIPLSVVAGKQVDSATYAQAAPWELAEWCAPRSKHVVITGGEPCVNDLTELTTMLIKMGKTVQIETSGTEPVRVHNATWVTVSPKMFMPGGRELVAQALERADEIKFPVGRPSDVERLSGLVTRYPGLAVKPIWLQPLSQNSKATALCVQEAIARQWRVSIQTHKTMGVR